MAVVGLDRFDHKRNYVFASNHVSLMDAPAIVACAPQKVRFVAKKSLFYVPVWGQALWAAGNISVDRAKSGSAARRLQGLLAATYSAETIAAWVDESVRMRKVR